MRIEIIFFYPHFINESNTMKFNVLVILTFFFLCSTNTNLIGQSIRVIFKRKFKLCEQIRKVTPVEQLSKIDKDTKKAVSHYSFTICPKYSKWQFENTQWDCTLGIRENNRPMDYIQYDTSDVKLMKFHFDPKEQYYIETHNMSNWPMQWDIDFSRTKTILGHRCFWAKPKRKNAYIIGVWFAPDIPTSYGPEVINGLPGLVLEFMTVVTHYVAISISSISPDLCPEIHIEEIKRINQNERNELWKNYDYSIKAQDFDCGGKAKKPK